MPSGICPYFVGICRRLFPRHFLFHYSSLRWIWPCPSYLLQVSNIILVKVITKLVAFILFYSYSNMITVCCSFHSNVYLHEYRNSKAINSYHTTCVLKWKNFKVKLSFYSEVVSNSEDFNDQESQNESSWIWLSGNFFAVQGLLTGFWGGYVMITFDDNFPFVLYLNCNLILQGNFGSKLCPSWISRYTAY